MPNEPQQPGPETRPGQFEEGGVRKSADVFPIPPVAPLGPEDLLMMQQGLGGSPAPSTPVDAAPMNDPGGGGE